MTRSVSLCIRTNVFRTFLDFTSPVKFLFLILVCNIPGTPGTDMSINPLGVSYFPPSLTHRTIVEIQHDRHKPCFPLDSFCQDLTSMCRHYKSAQATPNAGRTFRQPGREAGFMYQERHEENRRIRSAVCVPNRRKLHAPERSLQLQSLNRT